MKMWGQHFVTVLLTVLTCADGVFGESIVGRWQHVFDHIILCSLLCNYKATIETIIISIIWNTMIE